MLQQYLDGAIADVNSLIDLTNQDIADIQVANNEAIFSRNTQKNSLIKSFEQKKSLMEQEMQKLIQSHDNKPLAEILQLEPEIDKGLGDLRQSLQSLKDLNNAYAKSVFAVSEFYDSLLRRLVPCEDGGYSNPSKTKSHIVQIQV